MKATRIFETTLYAEDLKEARRFYTEVLGLKLIRETDLFLVFRLLDGVLLIFNPEESAAKGRAVPSHGCQGPGHLAFTAREEDIDRWVNHLKAHNVPVEAIVEMEEGGRSLYFRDPAGNTLEFAPPTLWGGNWEFGNS